MFVKFVSKTEAGNYVTAIWECQRVYIKPEGDRYYLTAERDGGSETSELPDDGNLEAVYLLNDRGETIDKPWVKPMK